MEEGIDLDSFSCEKEDYDKYLCTTVHTDHYENVGKVWIFTTRQKKAIGYITLVMSHYLCNTCCTYVHRLHF